ncbi:aminotransferase class I/II-fold pyridoxal phosphate-dependent enzyme [Parapusillimonas sp. SGNA-6]|nr:aminotransferase class I/II-fold pyridoxal phosphate-dependent enzyme [Parapusillimonas sp. SGNA-6]
MSVVDVRSDIVTQPTEAMLEAMVAVGRQPRQYGYREDVDLITLERLAAEIFQKDDALFLPTCTMANQIALMVRCQRGTNFIVDANAHINNFEAASTIGIAGAIPRVVSDFQGHPTAAALDEALSLHQASLVWLENTHNRAGGTVLRPDRQLELVATCRAHGVPIHVDGARIWNAAAALGCEVSELTRDVDSISASLNKGLGVPLGAVLAGSTEFIAAAEQIQLMLGGGWRPTGIIAAAGVVALKNLSLDELIEDHRVARQIAESLAKYPWMVIDASRLQTNLILVEVREDVKIDLLSELRKRGVLATPAGKGKTRLVVYRQIRAREVEAILKVFADLDSLVGTTYRQEPLETN